MLEIFFLATRFFAVLSLGFARSSALLNSLTALWISFLSFCLPVLAGSFFSIVRSSFFLVGNAAACSLSLPSWFLPKGQESPICVVTQPDGTIPLRSLANHLQLDSTSMLLDGLLISTDSAGINLAATWRELKNVPNLSPGTEEAPIIVDGRGKVVVFAEKPFKFESFYICIGRRTYEEITRVTKATGIRHVFLQSLKKHKPECSSLKLKGGNEDFCLDEDETGWSELPRYQDYGDTRATPWLLFFVESEHR